MKAEKCTDRKEDKKDRVKRQERGSVQRKEMSYYRLIVMLNKFVRVLNAAIPICEPFNLLAYTFDRVSRTHSPSFEALLMNYLSI